MLQRLLPLVFLGISFLLFFTLFPQLFGDTPPEGAATPAAVQATPEPAPETPAGDEIDTSARTRIWNLVLVHPLENGLRFLTTTLGLDAGSAIILFTIIVKVVLLPLTIQQLRSQKAMQRLQPELRALQKKHSGEREKLSAETMALYRQHGVNPAAGCLPILLQMPILFGLYAALNNLGTQSLPENEPFKQGWLWVAHLNQPDVVVIAGITLPGLLPILAALTQWIQQKMMMQPSDDPQQRMQNQIFQFMPLMMLWFGLAFSAGLALYWVTQNVVGIVQQYFATGWGSLRPNQVLPAGTSGVAALPKGSNNGAVTKPARGAGATTARADGRAKSGDSRAKNGDSRAKDGGGASKRPAGPGGKGRRPSGKR